MSEVDFQMALLLQHRFEQEEGAHSGDLQLAKELQEQFEREKMIEKPPPGLVYKSVKSSPNSSKSLVDPSWELVDPTPDIFTLFILFNDRFFWNKLVAVCVSWSKRMTSCAGVCSYNGRGGLCSITLSEPLLKLRPRKDLVETLLHEMIHALLFVTHNNKDRDGHGPEFHKHMYRINKEAGTNITVYHDFHDEVRLYQQHWWRCDGRCQKLKPYFGMVRRATNRAPGPNDRWWGEHLRNCGGTFIKVKEPEKTTTKTTKEKKTENKENKSITDFFKNDNVKGFKDLKRGGVKGRSNSSSTIVVTKNSSSSDSTSFKPTIFNAKQPNTSTGSNSTKDCDSTSFKPTNFNANQIEASSTSSSSCSTDFLSTRDHWANKFATNTKKRQTVVKSSAKTKIHKTTDDCSCPVCNKKVPINDLNSHLDLCLTQESVVPTEETKECPLCNSPILSSNFDVHVAKCVEDLVDKSTSDLNNVSCVSCGKQVGRSELNAHLDDCMGGIFDGTFDENEKSNCPICMKLIEEEEMSKHLDLCLNSDTEIVETFKNDFF